MQVSPSPLYPKHPSASGLPAGFWEPVQGPTLIMLTPSILPEHFLRRDTELGTWQYECRTGGTQPKPEVRQESRAPSSWPRIPSSSEDYTLNPPATNQLPASAAAKASWPRMPLAQIISASIFTYQVLTTSQAKCPTVPQPLRKPGYYPQFSDEPREAH